MRKNSKKAVAAPKTTERKLREIETCTLRVGDLWGELALNPKNQWMYFALSEGKELNEYETADARIVPPFGLRTFVSTGSLHLPSHASTTSNVLQDVESFIRRYADIPDEWVLPIAAYIVMTWVFQRFGAVPYLRFLGEWGTGKTRLLQICEAVSFRGYKIGGNLTDAALFRSVDLIRGTVLIDEADQRYSDSSSGITKLLNTGNMPGFPAVRNKERPGGGYMPEAFDIFGPKVLTARARFKDDGLESRCITFETERREVRRNVPLDLNGTNFESEASGLRNRLLGFRFGNYDRINPNDTALRHLNARMAQIAAPLIAVVGVCDPKSQPKLIEFLNRYAENHQDPLLSAIAEALAGRTEDVPLTELTTRINAILAREGEDAVHVKRITAVMRAHRYRIEKTNGQRVVRLSAARDARDANLGMGYGEQTPTSVALPELQISIENKENRGKKRTKHRPTPPSEVASLPSLASLPSSAEAA